MLANRGQTGAGSGGRAWKKRRMEKAFVDGVSTLIPCAGETGDKAEKKIAQRGERISDCGPKCEEKGTIYHCWKGD